MKRLIRPRQVQRFRAAHGPGRDISPAAETHGHRREIRSGAPRPSPLGDVTGSKWLLMRVSTRLLSPSRFPFNLVYNIK